MPAGLARVAVLLGLAVGLAACHTVTGAELRPARLAEDNPQARERITAVLLRATREGRVTFGDSDLSKEPLIVVQPPAPGPREGNSPAMPAYFDLLTDGKACFLRARDGGSLYPLPDVDCRAR
jgi:hypothetical protein